MFKRIRNLWRISAIELPTKKDTLTEKLKELFRDKPIATIIDAEEKPDIFPEHNETIE